jgi:GNAT superfamily N-acetyltransferase
VTIVVREAVPAEYDAIGELTVAAYASYIGASDDGGYATELRDVAGRARACPIYVALDPATGRVVGGATYVPGRGNPYAEIERDGEAGVRMLAVAPEAQGRGAGTALAEALVARARSEGRRGMALLSMTTMTTAHHVYGRLGFARDPSRDWTVRPGLSLLCFAIDFARVAGAGVAEGAADAAEVGVPAPRPRREA